MRGDENVAREEGFEVYEGEGCGGGVEDLPVCLSLGARVGFGGGWLWWKSYLGGYGEGPEFDELVCEGCHFGLVLWVVSCLLGRPRADVVSVSTESVVEVGAVKSRASDVTSPSLRQQCFCILQTTSWNHKSIPTTSSISYDTRVVLEHSTCMQPPWAEPLTPSVCTSPSGAACRSRAALSDRMNAATG
jgi:hypothetical protein